jgi:DNA-directed RNA polymerase subunit F
VARRILSEKDITVSEADRALRSRKEEELDQFQRRTLEYTSKFSKVDADTRDRNLEEGGHNDSKHNAKKG